MRPLLVSVFALAVVAAATGQTPTGGGRAEPQVNAFDQFLDRVGGVLRAKPQSIDQLSSCTSPKGSVTFGTPITAYLGDAGTCYDTGVYADFWTMSGQAGQQVTVTFTSTPPILATIQDYTTGTVLASSSGCGITITCTFRYTLPATSLYFAGIGGARTGSYSLMITATGTSPPGGLPNLTPYRVLAGGTCTPPDLCSSDWSDKIVVSRSTGTHVDSASLTPSESLYVDWAVTNNGTGDISSRVYVALYVDSTLRTSWYIDPPLDNNSYVAVQDYSIGALSAGTHTIRIEADSTDSVAESNETDNEYTKTIVVGNPSAGCVATTSNLCLSSSRFKVSVAWQSPTGAGTGTAVGLTSDTGYFWFFSSNNIEMVIKVVDGRTVNGRFWVFAGGLTNVNVVITVTDTTTGSVKTYVNSQGLAFQPIQDTSAF